MRVKLYQALWGYAPLRAIVGERILEASAIGADIKFADEFPDLQGIPERPFVTYRMHTGFPLNRGLGQREYAQIWANDDPGDYMRIDEILRLCRLAVEAIPPADDFLEARWIETGVDLNDLAMGTINRYIRFQFTGTLRERE